MTFNALPKVARRGLADAAADRIREAILGGQLAPGAALREVELSAALDVSRGSVREGLSVLEKEGLVRSGWHRGTTVIEVTPGDVREVYAVRAALDRLAAGTARDRADEHQLAGLDALVEAMATEIDGPADGRRLLGLDLAFHDAIYEAAGNARLIQAWQALRSQVQLFQLRRITLGYEHYRRRVVPEHRELADLIRTGDRARLAQIAEEHVLIAQRELLAALERTARRP
jgi:DNA-binding GntR family transcriptional regulator